MGKGYNNYMCKKPFHPGSKANIKRTWMAEQRTENEKKKQDDLKVQYEKEQELYNNRALISTESKDKLELNFMYEAPPGAKRERQKEDDEPEYKFEWQRKYNAPREDFAKGNTEIRDQPFGIPVRNVRCIKCHKWGHINTDKECPLFSQASTSSMPTTSMDPLELMRQMREDGYNLKQSVLGHHLNPQAANQQLLESEEEDPEREFLQSLSTKQKQKLLKKLNKISKKQAKSDSSCGKKKKNKKHKSKRKSSESEPEREKERKKAKKMTKRPVDDDDDSSKSSDCEEEKEVKYKTKKSGDHCHESSNKTKKSTDQCHQSSDKIKKSIEQDCENSNSSASSDSDDDRSKERRDRRKSATKGKHSGKKLKETKEVKTESSTSKIVSLKHSTKKKAKNDSKDISFGGGSADELLSGSEGRTKVHVKQEGKVTSSKHETKRKSNASGSDSGSSESSPEGHRSKRLKPDRKEDTSCPVVVEPSCSQTQTIGSVSTEKPPSDSCLKSNVNVSEACMNEMSNSPEHPDSFICSTPPDEPETSEKPNLATFLLARKYHGDRDEKFRRINRDRRSPSFKQKYRLA